MCGRYLMTAPGNLLQVLFGFNGEPVIEPRCNPAPSQMLPVACGRGRGGWREEAGLQHGHAEGD